MSATTSPRRSPSLSAGLLLGAVALASLVACAAGCGRARARECSDVVARINEGVKENEAFEAERRKQQLDSPRQTAVQMTDLGDIYQKQTDRISALALTDKGLKIEVDAYNQAIKRAVGGTRLLASGIKNNRPEEARQGDETYAKAVAEQKTLIASINGYCAAP